MKLKKLLRRIAEKRPVPAPILPDDLSEEDGVIVVDDGSPYSYRLQGYDDVNGLFIACDVPQGFKDRFVPSSFKFRGDLKKYLARKKLPLTVDAVGTTNPYGVGKAWGRVEGGQKVVVIFHVESE